MKHLRQYIRQILLTEGIKTIEDIPEGVKVEIDEFGYRTDINLSSSFDKTRFHKPYGTISIEEIDNEDKIGNCGGAWAIAMVTADQGWGPFLYDIAIEWATQNANGLIADRSEVSSDARRVWAYYLNNRTDVTAHQLDDPFNYLTPEGEDNCDQEMAGGRHQMYGGERDRGSDWVDSPLSKRYTKPPTTINALKAAGKWDNRGES
ncbi:MAG: hypothetical protein CBC29_06620 [Methylococcaceae bacterium TMED69]|nr:MAG: hypothetical protein CBC29_06620 [Methylococcaceae bacterium TMED69]|tara:strand:+ start:1026 stop:1640 length:615 start_codon:yes stop_codon:yes gene_type:complete